MQIGPYSHPGQVIVAPMAGVTDQPFRNLCRQNGSYWVVSEMVTSDPTLWHTAKSSRRLQYHDEAEPRWVQIAGGDPDMLAHAARFNQEQGAQILDINMGCPAKKVCRKAAGSALLKDEKLVADILQAVVAAVDIPVTLKIRLGWSLDQINAPEIARIAEQSGISLLTVHGRSRACKFGGVVHYDEIARVVEAVEIPVVANGDITTPAQAAAVLDHTGAAGVMVGRAAQGQPWLPATMDFYIKTGEMKKNPTTGEIKGMLTTHVNELESFYGELMGPRIARKHVGWYVKSLVSGQASKAFMQEFNALARTAEQVRMIEDKLETLEGGAEAAA